jgi:MFS family permease
VIGGTIGLVLFVFVEAKQPAPMMPLDVFHSRNFVGANLLTLLLYAALSGALFFVPFNLIQVQGYSPIAAGSALLPFVFIMFFLSRWAGGLVARYGSRLPLFVGPVIAALGFVLFAIPQIGGSYWKTFFPAVCILGVGMAISVAPLTTTVMNSVTQRRSGTAAGINNAAARLAGLLAIALLGLSIQSTFDAQLNRQMASLRIPAPLQEAVKAQHSKLAAIEIPKSIESSQQIRIQHSIDESFIAAFRRVVLICAMLAFVSGLVAAFTISNEYMGIRGSGSCKQS